MVQLKQDGISNCIVAVVFVAIDTLVVALRIISKKRTSYRLRNDDHSLSVLLQDQRRQLMVGLQLSLSYSAHHKPRDFE